MLIEKKILFSKGLFEILEKLSLNLKTYEI